MKHHITSILFVFLSTIAFSQSIERQVIGSSGFSTNNTAAQISFTLGETVIFSGIQSNSTITQGFQQAEEEDFVSTVKTKNSVQAIHVYPVPASSYLNIKSVLSPKSSSIHYTIQDLRGREILTGEISDNFARLDIQSLASSTYLLVLTSEKLDINQKVKFVKM